LLRSNVPSAVSMFFMILRSKSASRN